MHVKYLFKIFSIVDLAMIRHELLKNTLLLAIGVFFAILVFEYLGRLIPNNIGFREVTSYRRFHPVLGFEIDNSFRSISRQSSCFKIDNISINDYGMRSTKNYIEGGKYLGARRIAVLGDSFMEGREVSNNEHFSSILENHLINTDVLNFGVNAYGTIQEYLTYLIKAEKFSPDITVLAFLESNDVANNSEFITGKTVYRSLRPFFSDKLDEIIYPSKEVWDSKQTNYPGKDFHLFLKRNSFTYFVLYKFALKPVKELIKRNGTTIKVTDKKENTYWWEKSKDLLVSGVYQDPPDAIWERAWLDTEKAIKRLDRAVKEKDGYFIIMLISNIEQVDQNRAIEHHKSVLNGTLPENFSLSYPVKRLINFADKNKIHLLDLNKEFLKYKAQHNLSYPYFYFRCDGHWNPLGHYIAARSFVEFMQEHGMIENDDIDEEWTADEINHLLKSPKAVLGSEVWEQIYDGGVYVGNSLVGAEYNK